MSLLVSAVLAEISDDWACAQILSLAKIPQPALSQITENVLLDRNAGVLFFNDAPEKFLPGAQIDVVVFPEGEAGDKIIEKSFKGPVQPSMKKAHVPVRDGTGRLKPNDGACH